MASENWSHDFCLSCDRQTAEGAYCSQACRLADLEKAGNSEPNSPLSYSSSVSASSYGSTASGSGFYLPPAVNFSAFSKASSTRSPTTQTTASYFTQQQQQPSTTTVSYQTQSSSSRGLATSSSRASLASIASSSANPAISEHAMSQLRGYVSSFDQTRDFKRRMTTP